MKEGGRDPKRARGNWRLDGLFPSRLWCWFHRCVCLSVCLCENLSNCEQEEGRQEDQSGQACLDVGQIFQSVATQAPVSSFMSTHLCRKEGGFQGCQQAVSAVWQKRLAGRPRGWREAHLLAEIIKSM